MAVLIGLVPIHVICGGSAVLALVRSYYTSIKSMDGDLSRRVQRLSCFRHVASALCVLLWVCAGVLLGLHVLPLVWRWSFAASTVVAYIFEVAIGWLALGHFPQSAALGPDKLRAVCSARLVGFASLPFVTAPVCTEAHMYILSVWSAVVVSLFALVIVAPQLLQNEKQAVTKAIFSGPTTPLPGFLSTQGVAPIFNTTLLPSSQPSQATEEEVASLHEDLTELREQNMLMRAELVRVRAMAANAIDDTAVDATSALFRNVVDSSLIDQRLSPRHAEASQPKLSAQLSAETCDKESQAVDTHTREIAAVLPPAVQTLLAGEVSASSSTAASSYNEEAFDREHVVRLVGGEKLLKMVFSNFYKSNVKTAENITKALKQADWPRLRRLAHTLKGASSYLGAHATVDASRKLMLSAEGAVRGHVHLDELKANAAAVLAALEWLLGSLQDPSLTKLASPTSRPSQGEDPISEACGCRLRSERLRTCSSASQ
mmetsp:Transcript_24141/g.47046  ORF Transcript_24141/g.47046 Transcript_24141/m.47046 type:complete len:487 (-) Transcript_24141:190-1650(-)